MRSDSLAHSSIGTPLPRQRRGSDSLIAYGFRYYFIPLPGCFSPFPRGTGSLSITNRYLALDHSRPGFLPRFTYKAVLENNHHRAITPFAYRAFTFSGSCFHRILLGKLWYTPYGAYLYSISELQDSERGYLTTPLPLVRLAPFTYRARIFRRTNAQKVRKEKGVWAVPFSLAATQGIARSAMHNRQQTTRVVGCRL